MKDTKRLKEQKDTKRIRDEIALKVQADKASEAYMEILFLFKLYEDGKCWDSVMKLEQELAKINMKINKLRALKQQICIYIKGIGFSEYHTA